MRLLFASAEVFPLAKTGGLADVSGALPQALAALGVDVEVIMPGYPQALLAAEDKTVEREFLDRFAKSRLIRGRMPGSGLPVWLVDCPALFDRAGSLYQDQDGNDWPDNADRFAHFCDIAARLALGELVEDYRVDVVHANDWHTGLLPLYLQRSSNPPRTLFTIHNLAYQGLFAANVLPSLGLPFHLFTPDGIEFYGKLSFLKAGIRFSDRVTTVSPSYAREIMTEDYGCKLDGLLRHRMKRTTGILNGVDYEIWDPSDDLHLPANFDSGDLTGKTVCKAALQHELGLAVDPQIPLVVWLSRITDQKMADVVCHAMASLLERDIQLAMLGQGDHALENQFEDAAEQYPGRLAVRIGYEEPLAHRFHAGADLLLHPCRFEPCGLTPLYAMRYGTLPVVRHVGGLSDTIVDATQWTIQTGSATGFAFRDASAPAMLDCLDRALAFYAQAPIWRMMQQRAMTREFGWDASARRYLALYRRLVPQAVTPAAAEGNKQRLMMRA
ncbi:MAG: glycogen synthase GlgA [Gemmatimonas sp.]|jgi:starch synthase